MNTMIGGDDGSFLGRGLTTKNVWEKWQRMTKDTLEDHYKTVIYSTVFSPCGRYFLCCGNTKGWVTIWDFHHHHHSNNHSNNNEKSICFKLQIGKNDPTNINNNNNNNNILHQIDFHHHHHNEMVYLTCCGTNGIYMYRWNDILSNFITKKKTLITISDCPPYQHFFSSITEMKTFCIFSNHDSNTSSSLLCASGVNHGQVCIWDISTGQLLSTLTTTIPCIRKIIQSPSSSGNSSILVAGDKDTNNNEIVSIWDVQQNKLIENISWPSSFKHSHTNPTTRFNNNNHKMQKVGTHAMAYNLDHADWIGLGGRFYSCYNNNNNNNDCGGFLATLHLPTRTINSVQETRETIHDLLVSSHHHCIYSIGNEGVISCWENASNLQSRTCRAWLSTPSAFAISTTTTTVNNDNDEEQQQILTVAGKGTTIDCFSIPKMMNHSSSRYTIDGTSFLGTKSHSLVLQ